MPLDEWLAYLLTVLALMSTPGPSHLLMLSNSLAHGFKRSLATGAGDLTANALQMLAAGLGLATLVFASKSAFSMIKWLGVLYLLWLGLKMLVQASKRNQEQQIPERVSSRRLWLQGFITSAANPKAVVFFAALFPQFIDPVKALLPQLLILSATYLIVDALFLASYGAGADRLSQHLQGAARAWLDRIGGGFMIGAAILLGLRTVREQ